MIMIHPGADMRGGVRQDPSAMQTLKLADYEALRDETNFLSADEFPTYLRPDSSSPETITTLPPSTMQKQDLTSVSSLSKIKRCLPEADIQSSAKVCVIGKTIVDNLFPDGSDPVGKIIQFQQNTASRGRCAQIERLQLYGTGSGRRRACALHHSDETPARRHLPARHLASALADDMTDYATKEVTQILPPQS